MKSLAPTLCIFFLFSSYLYSQKDVSPNNHSILDSSFYYIGTNPLSYMAALQLEDNFKRYIPEVTGLEYGFSLIGGYYVKPKLALEARFSIGVIHQVSRVGQFHFGTNYYMLRPSEKWYRNIYSGCFLKFWDYYNKLTKIHFYNVAPYIAIGNMFEINPIILDIRINQTIAIYSWSSLEHSSPGIDWFFSPWPKFLPVMPSLTFSIDYKF